MNYFQEDLAFSHKAEDLSIWKEIYQKAFPGFLDMISYRDSGDHQKAGIDRGVYLKNAKEVLIDEKVRRGDYKDIALEFISNDRTGALGWVCKPLRADFIAYTILSLQTCYLLPVRQMQQAWAENQDQWKKSYTTKKAPNEGYSTHFCPVPVDVLYYAIGQCLRVNFTYDPKTRGVA